MNSCYNSDDTICSAGTSRENAEINERDKISDNSALKNSATISSVENEPSTSGNRDLNNGTDNQSCGIIVQPKIDKNALSIILQHTLHRPINILSNTHFENVRDQIQKNKLKHAKNFHRLSRSSRGVELEENVSSNSSSEDSISLNAKCVTDRENGETLNIGSVNNRRVDGILSEGTINFARQNSSTVELTQARSEVRVSNNVEVDFLRLRDDYVTTENYTPPIPNYLQRDNRIILETLPETPHHNIGPNRNTFRGNRILKYYRTLRGTIDTDRPTSSTSQQTSPHAYSSSPPLTEAPPTYSTVLRNEETDDTVIFTNRNMEVQQSPPFIAPRPPPTYAEAEGFNIERPLFLASSNFVFEQLVWGPEPTYIVCPRCAHLILTTTHTRISSINHVSAIILCLCGCWPCCFIPYCIDSCKNTYHYCPNCSLFLGVYRPW